MPNPLATHNIQLTNCDWLSFSVLMALDDIELHNEPILNTPPGYIIQQLTGTNLYKRRAIVYNDHGDKILTLLYQPHSKIIDIHSLFVEVANRLLYTNFDWILDLLSQIHTFVWQSLSRFDIATDFNPTKHQQTIIDMLQAGTAYVSGKREGSMFHDYRNESSIKRRARCMSWGSKHSDVKFKLYNKSLEIHDTDKNGRTWCTKPYIQTMWLRHNLDIKNVWRLEVSIMGAASYQWHGEKLGWNITDTQAFTMLFYDLVSHRFTIRKNEGHTNKRYDHELIFLDIPDLDHYRLRKVDPRDMQHHTDHAATIRAIMRELERPETQCNRTITLSLLGTLESVVYAAHLEGYFHRAIGQSIETWTEEYKNQLPN